VCNKLSDSITQSARIKTIFIHVEQTACWPLAPKFAGSNPAEAVGFFGYKNPQHAFLRRGSKRICHMSQLCGMSKNLVIYVKYRLLAKF